HPVGGEPQIIERGTDAGQIILGFRRQCQRTVLPDEQANSQLLLEPFDLMADRGLRDVQLGSRLRKAQMPGGGLERAQSIERARSTRRRTFLERRRSRGRKAVLTGLTSSQAGAASSWGRRPRLFRATGAIR